MRTVCTFCGRDGHRASRCPWRTAGYGVICFACFAALGVMLAWRG